MCKKHIRVFKWGYMINGKENGLKMKKRSSRYDINRPRRWRVRKYTK